MTDEIVCYSEDDVLREISQRLSVQPDPSVSWKKLGAYILVTFWA